MSKSTPSLLALLGLVAVAGYQNRSRISDMLADAGQTPRDGATPEQGPDRGNFLADIGQTLKNGVSGSGLSAALGDLVARFQTTNQGSTAESWVSTSANRPINVVELETALGAETLTDLARKTGLSRQEILLRLNVALPEMVDQLTPNGRLPADTETTTHA